MLSLMGDTSDRTEVEKENGILILTVKPNIKYEMLSQVNRVLTI